MKTHSWALVIAVSAALIAALLAACGATGAPAYGALAAPTAAVMQTMIVQAAPAATGAPTAAPAAVVAQAGNAAAPRAQAGRMIVKNAEMELLVADADAALDGVTAIASDYGGYIVSSHTWFEADYKYATVRLGVPVADFENVLRRLRGLALKVNSETASGEDVTDQFVDLQSQLTNLQATQARIRQFLDKAVDVKEALEVNTQLSQIEGQIEQIQGQMNYLRDRSAYSTINVQLVPQKPTPTPSPTPTPTPTPTPVAWRPGETIGGAADVLVSILKGLVDVAIWVIIVLGPFALPVILVVWFLIRRQRRAAARRRAGPPAPSAPPAPAPGA